MHRKRNWLYESKTEEFQRRITALEANIQSLHLIIQDAEEKLIEHRRVPAHPDLPPIPEPETEE